MAKTAAVPGVQFRAAGRKPAARKGRKTAAARMSRAAGAKPPPRLTPEIVGYLDKVWAANPAQLICLAYGHLWPILLPGRGRPRGWRPWRVPGGGGVFGIDESCVRDELGTGETCGRIRVSHTGERGIIFLERGTHRVYKNEDDDRWLVRPEGAQLTRLDVIDYLTWTMGDELFAGIEEGEGE
jgi:hypothetical protein